jgi:hypothetical protein
MYFASPTQSFGYYRGTPYYGGSGSGMGPNMAGNGVFSAGQGNAGNSGWSPTILYMLALVILEMIVFAWLGKHI